MLVYAKPGVKPLKYDVFSPKGAKNLPCIIIIHGGGWTTNTEDIMRGLARELTKDGKFVVFSIDYRWAMKLDGDATNNTMADIAGDVFGAIAHIMEHAAEYGGDPSELELPEIVQEGICRRWLQQCAIKSVKEVLEKPKEFLNLCLPTYRKTKLLNSSEQR